jgi:hypothetical protein
MVFNIGSQQGGVFNNVAGNQNVYGDQHAGAPLDLGDVRDLLQQLQNTIHRSPLPATTSHRARAEIDAAVAASTDQRPDKGKIAGHLTRLAGLLSAAGALATAGTALGAPLAVLAGWLGSLGDPIRRAIDN